MASLEKLKGISEQQIERLHAAGVRGTEGLLKWGSTPDGRKQIAHQTRISLNRITDWVHRVDLMRVKGIDDDYARLLARAGVHSIVDLSTRNPIELDGEIEIAAAVERLVKRVPSRKVLGGWIEQARLMLRHVWYHDTWGEPSVTGREAPGLFPTPRV
ncbi:MAG: DUF4332 domain-containing protein [Actinomycetota bacterium]